MVYKFATLSRAEVKAMLGLDLSEEPRAIREAKEEGREEQAIALVTRQLTRRLGQELSEEVRSQLLTLSLPVLEDLGEALLDFTSLAQLQAWLEERSITDSDLS
jgi:predicted transposase YdaD